jgi:hypothetical protein
MFYVNSEWNWAPVRSPLLGPALAVASPFEITTGGKFTIQADVPVAEAANSGPGLPESPPAACQLEVRIEGSNGFRATIPIVRFTSSGGYPFGKTESFSSGQDVELSRGSYVFRLINRGTTTPFGERGAMVTFTRFLHPTESYLQGVLLRGVGWFGLIVGIVAACASELTAKRYRAERPA